MTNLHASHRKKGQLELLPIVLLLLIPTTIIFAENITNITQPDLMQTFENVTQAPEPIIVVPNDTLTTPELTVTLPNETQTTLPQEDNTMDITVPENISIDINQNTTIEQNATENILQNETLEQSPQTDYAPEPVQEQFKELNVDIIYPTKITRTETLNLTAVVTNPNSVSVKNVFATWNLPSGFEIVSGSQTEFCGILEVNASCTSMITIQSSLASQLGTNEIKVSVSYEK